MALQKLPQKVIAKYGGDNRPEYLKNSTRIKLMKWIPQNDLLGEKIGAKLVGIRILT